MADSYDQASGQIDENKRAMLAAMAQAGTAGVQAYQRAQSDIAAQRQAAVDQALRGAASMNNTPPALMEQMRSTISTPYDRYNADLTAAQAYGQQSNAAAQAANASYFDQAKAAIPALRTYSQAKSADAALDRQLKELEIQKRQQDLGQGPDGSMSLIPGLNKQFGGAAGGSRALLAAAKAYVTENGGNWGHKGTTALLEQFDQEAGLPPGYTRALLPKAAASKPGVADSKAKSVGINAATAKKIRGYKEYKQISLAVGEWSKEMRRAEFIAAVNGAATLKNKPLTRQLLIAEYASLFTTGKPKK